METDVDVDLAVSPKIWGAVYKGVWGSFRLRGVWGLVEGRCRVEP